MVITDEIDVAQLALTPVRHRDGRDAAVAEPVRECHLSRRRCRRPVHPAGAPAGLSPAARDRVGTGLAAGVADRQRRHGAHRAAGPRRPAAGHRQRRWNRTAPRRALRHGRRGRARRGHVDPRRLPHAGPDHRCAARPFAAVGAPAGFGRFSWDWEHSLGGGSPMGPLARRRRRRHGRAAGAGARPRRCCTIGCTPTAPDPTVYGLIHADLRLANLLVDPDPVGNSQDHRHRLR